MLNRLVILRFAILKPRAFGIKNNFSFAPKIGSTFSVWRTVVIGVAVTVGSIWWLGDRIKLELKSIVGIAFKLLVLKSSFSQSFMQAIKFLARRDVPLALKCRPDAFKSVLLMLLF